MWGAHWPELGGVGVEEGWGDACNCTSPVGPDTDKPDAEEGGPARDHPRAGDHRLDEGPSARDHRLDEGPSTRDRRPRSSPFRPFARDRSLVIFFMIEFFLAQIFLATISSSRQHNPKFSHNAYFINK